MCLPMLWTYSTALSTHDYTQYHTRATGVLLIELLIMCIDFLYAM